MKRIGITGGIGSGKTTVSHLFQELGAPVYIADDEAKRLMHQSPVKEEITALFGADAYDTNGWLNRKYIAAIVFKNKEKLNRLNAVVHPAVEKDFEDWVARQQAPYVIYEAAILYETGRYKQFDYTVLITAPVAVRIERLMKRDGASAREIKDRMKNQWPDEDKQKLADWVIHNEDLSVTIKEVMKIHEFLLKN